MTLGLLSLSASPTTPESDRTPIAAGLSRIPGFFDSRHFPAQGGLVSYGPDVSELFAQPVKLVDPILRSAKLADLPVEMSTRYEPIVNLKTAKALDNEIPQSLLLRADRVIE